MFAIAMHLFNEAAETATEEITEAAAEEAGYTILRTGGTVLLTAGAIALVGYGTKKLYNRWTNVEENAETESKDKTESKTESKSEDAVEINEDDMKFLHFVSHMSVEDLKDAGIDIPQINLIADNRPFISVEAITKVNGIGDATLEKLRQAYAKANIRVVNDTNEEAESESA